MPSSVELCFLYKQTLVVRLRVSVCSLIVPLLLSLTPLVSRSGHPFRAGPDEPLPAPTVIEYGHGAGEKSVDEADKDAPPALDHGDYRASRNRSAERDDFHRRWSRERSPGRTWDRPRSRSPDRGRDRSIEQWASNRGIVVAARYHYAKHGRESIIGRASARLTQQASVTSPLIA